MHAAYYGKHGRSHNALLLSHFFTEKLYRSAVSFTCARPRTRTRLGDRSFAVAGPRVWNCLPAALRAVEDYERFKKLLKTHLFDYAAAPSNFLL